MILKAVDYGASHGNRLEFDSTKVEKALLDGIEIIVLFKDGQWRSWISKSARPTAFVYNDLLRDLKK